MCGGPKHLLARHDVACIKKEVCRSWTHEPLETLVDPTLPGIQRRLSQCWQVIHFRQVLSVSHAVRDNQCPGVSSLLKRRTESPAKRHQSVAHSPRPCTDSRLRG